MAFMSWKILLSALCIGTIAVLIRRAFYGPLSKLPGPWYSLLTDKYLMYKEFTGQRRTYTHALHRKYGQIVRVGPNEASFNSLEAMKEIYQSGGSGYDKTEFYTMFQQFRTRVMFSTLEKADHTKKKRHMAGPYTNTNIMHPEVLAGLSERASAFMKRVEQFKDTGLDVYIYLHCYALDCASFHLLNPYGTKSIEGSDMVMMEELSYHDSLIRNLAQYRWPTLSNYLEKAFKPRPAPLANNYILTSAAKAPHNSHSLAHKLHSCGAFQKMEIAAECMNQLLAGIDTTGDTLCFLMHQLSLPSTSYTQKIMREEFEKNRDKNIDELPYLEAVVKEGLRCFPPVPMSQPRYVPAGGREIDGVWVKEGTIVSCQAWSLHRLNEDIFEQGDRFWPERWMSDDKEKVLEMNRLFFTFSAGGRGCTGRFLAIAEMKTLLREIYSRYTTRIAPDMKASMALSDQVINTRPLDQSCTLLFEPVE